MPTERYDPTALLTFIATTGGNPSIRAVARRLHIDPAILCRPLTPRQADHYATRLGAHPAIIWPTWWHHS